ncbi:protein ERGIC-53 isoform X2 [Chrysoperla carnea]|uniref:protein ERGIC-53 isoform X2 n=1 Tax=Chrysoperla carnea TaxID=189513 RepID=UPI001D06F6C0|nr:protein ERGIC-53 isoform X2 [Chrysoperla carnea]
MAVDVRFFNCSSLLVIFYILTNFLLCSANIPHRKFEYKYSFKPPYLAQKDGTVPFWEYGGYTIASAENVRIVPSLKSQKGAIWTVQPTNFDWWEVEIVFRITGRGRIGADGLAFWYTSNKGAYGGDVFGSSDKWNGLGIFFDSFDNDNKHNNPYIYAIVNDGTKAFDHQNDGMTQAIAGCLRDFRNKPFPTKARIEYYQNTLTVSFHNGMTNNEQDFEMCLRAENVYLPKNGYFGLSAATGGLADDHDVFHFLTTSLYPPGQFPDHTAGEEQLKLNQEYQDYQKKLEQQQDDYRKEHPDQVPKHKQEELDEWYETDNQRELRQIFQGQSSIFESIRELNRKLDEVVGRQERTLSLLSATAGSVQVPVGGGVPPPPAGGAGYVDTIRRHEVDAILTNQNTIVQTAREIKNFVTDIKARSDQIINTQARQPTAQVQSVGYDMQSVVNEMRDGLNHVKQSINSVAQVLNRPGGAQAQVAPCPTQSCVSVTTFLVIAVVQLVVTLGYQIYKDSKNTQSKKFY